MPNRMRFSRLILPNPSKVGKRRRETIQIQLFSGLSLGAFSAGAGKNISA